MTHTFNLRRQRQVELLILKPVWSIEFQSVQDYTENPVMKNKAKQTSEQREVTSIPGGGGEIIRQITHNLKHRWIFLNHSGG